MELVGWNVVVTANQFNPSILTQIWLAKTGIVSADEFEPPSIFADGVSQVHTRNFQLLVIPQMLQFAPKPGVEQEGSLIAEKVGSIIRALPHTPYTAIGLNFTWQVAPHDETISEMTRRLFFKPDQSPYSAFDAPNAGFGAYLSKEFNGLRMRLDIKPIIPRVSEKPDEDRLAFMFNFHRDLGPENAVKAIEQSLLQWDMAKSESRRIVADTMGLEAR